jgi:hypothetical protein
MGIGLSPEKIEKIKEAQKRHSFIDPSCLKLSPEEFVNWHPVGGMSWEERARLMEESGLTDEEADIIETHGTGFISASV